MTGTLSARLQRLRQRLTRLDEQPLGQAALVVILFLDFFILSSIFDGLEDHTRQLASPEERIPQLCRDIVIDGDWGPGNRLNQLARRVAEHQARAHFPLDTPAPPRLHPLCAPLLAAYDAISDDARLARDLARLLDMGRETTRLRAELEQMKGAYDTRLLETIAGQASPGADTATIRRAMAEKTAALNTLLQDQERSRWALEQDPKVAKLFSLAARGGNAGQVALQEALRDELRRLDFWYPAQRLGMEMLFLLPLLAAFYFWNSRSIAAGRPFQTLVSSHLLVVACIPVIFKVLELVYDIIPRHLLRQLLELLESLKLVALWHYLLIIGAILAALALIYLLQKKLFSRERLLLRRIARGQCQACGLRLPRDKRYCPACGASQYRTCRHCQGLTLVHGRYCTQCGREDA